MSASGDGVVDGTERHTGDRHDLGAGEDDAAILGDTQRLRERHEVALIARLEAPQVGDTVVERLCLVAAAHKSHALDRVGDHAVVLRIDVGRLDELTPDDELLSEPAHRRVGDGDRAHLRLLVGEQQRAALVLGCVERLRAGDRGLELQPVIVPAGAEAQRGAAGPGLRDRSITVVPIEVAGAQVEIDLHVTEERVVIAQPLLEVLEQHRAFRLGHRGTELRKPGHGATGQQLLALERPLDGAVDVAGIGRHTLGVVVLVGASRQHSEPHAVKRSSGEQSCGERRESPPAVHGIVRHCAGRQR